MKEKNDDCQALILSAGTRPRKQWLNEHPTPMCDDERSETFTRMEGWAVKPTYRDVLPVARQPAHAERATTHGNRDISGGDGT